ncbi:MAG: PIN domain-containing protein [Akkermansiaceae bacterium]|nr:PIN domain-containing protein [Akkermansiaceae bacterium]
MTLIDTSAWIEFFRPQGDTHFKSLVRDLVVIKQAAYTCPVAFELVTGARKEELDDLRTGLDLASRIALLPEHWDLAGSLNAGLRAKGINLPASDLLIATVAHSVKLPLLAKDAHFETIREHALPELKILSPSLP